MKTLRNEAGSVMLLSMLLIMLLSMIAIWSTQTSKVETMVSRNDTMYKMCFYEADGGAEMGIELLEQNMELRGHPKLLGSCSLGAVGIVTSDANFATPFLNTPLSSSEFPAYNRRDAFFPKSNTSANPPFTNVLIGGTPTAPATGSAIQMVAGYEGKGKGLASGGAWVVYDIRARHQDVQNAEATINLNWRHVM